ncbi:MAG: iron-containing alcohol dehydrogenase [Phycisphaerales bacterium]|nr:iron-containing alcohol dehydrogenase [Phycisphaerales bacterium]
MLNFEFSAPTKLVFGRDTHKQIGERLKPLAKKVLLHYGGQSIKKSGLYDQVTASLKASGVPFVELGGVVPNPRVSLVREGVALCRKENVDLILAVGGGSVIDSAKGIALGYHYNGDVWDFYTNKAVPTKAIPVATILTLPAAGSEVSDSSVLSDDTNQQKLYCGAEFLSPVISVMNPELFMTLPKNQIANGVADMMSHIFERYFTNTLQTDVTDGLCETLLRTIMKNALAVIDDPKNYEAWCEVGLAGTLAHNNLVGLGRGQDWACHMMEHELSAIYDIAHGAGLAILTPNWMKYVYKSNIGMFVQFAVKVMGVDGSFREPEAIVLEGITRLSEFFKKMGLPATLGDVGIDAKNIELMAKKATGVAYGRAESPLGGLKSLGWRDVKEIMTASL